MTNECKHGLNRIIEELGKLDAIATRACPHLSPNQEIAINFASGAAPTIMCRIQQFLQWVLQLPENLWDGDGLSSGFSCCAASCTRSQLPTHRQAPIEGLEAGRGHIGGDIDAALVEEAGAGVRSRHTAVTSIPQPGTQCSKSDFKSFVFVFCLYVS